MLERDRVMPKLDYRNIERDPARCGGQPVVAGTRIRVAIILGCYRQGMGIEEIVQQYPSLKPADVHDALAYAYDHLAEIEEAVAAGDEAMVRPVVPVMIRPHERAAVPHGRRRLRSRRTGLVGSGFQCR